METSPSTTKWSGEITPPPPSLLPRVHIMVKPSETKVLHHMAHAPFECLFFITLVCKDETLTSVHCPR